MSLSVYEPLHIDGISLKFKGFERTKLVETRTTSYTVNGQTRTRVDRIPHFEKRIIFRRCVNLHDYKATLNPGIYVYPFKFRLDDRIPGSFSVSHGDASGCIVYKLKAEVVRPGMFQANIKHTQIIPVSTRFDLPIEKIQACKEDNVTRLCCIDMGQLTCSAILDKNAYTAGEVARLIIAIDNTASDVTLDHIAFKLTNSVFIKASSYSETLRITECKNQAPRIPKGETAHISFTLNLPKILNPTTDGYLIRSYYYFEVVMSVPCSKDVVLNLPVTVFARDPDNFIAAVEYPSDRPPKYEASVEISNDMFKVY